MSIKVFGVLELCNIDFTLQERVMRKKTDISFSIAEAAIKNKIGINLGGNVFSGFMQKYEKSLTRIPFELIDDPMDLNAECLFIGDGIKVQVGKLRVDAGEPLSIRMLKVQSFLFKLLNTEYINKIILDINALDIDEDNIKLFEIRADDFCSRMLDLYKQNDNWTPAIRIVIHKA